MQAAKDEYNINSIVHNAQFVNGFPDIRLVYDEISKARGNLNERVVAAYNRVFKEDHYKEIGRGLAADFIAVALFLMFSYHKNEDIVW